MSSIVKKYQDILTPDILFNFSSQRHAFGNDGVANRFFVVSLCSNRNHFHNFLREFKLIKDQLNCPKCNTPMKIKPDKRLNDGFVWVCRGMVSGKVCGCTRSIRDGSWFRMSKLSMEEVFLLTYEIVKGSRSTDILEEYCFSEHTVVDWKNFVREKMLDYVETNSEKIGGLVR